MDSAPEVNTPRAVMLSIAEIADRDGVSRPAVSQRVKRLVELHDLQVELDERGRVGAVNVAQYDLLRERNGDPSKDQRPSQPTEPVRVADSYDEALRQKTWYEATRKGLELDEQIGKLVRVDELAQAAADCGAEIAAIVGRIEGEADVLAAAGMRDGPHGLRVALKQIKARMLGEIAVALDNLAKLKPAATGESPDGN